MDVLRCAFCAVAFTAGVIAVTKPANAAPFNGKFTLDYGIRWGSVWLPAGQYNVTTRAVPFERMLFVTNENGLAAIIPAGTISAAELDERAHLELTDVGGSYVVTRLCTPGGGTVYTFPISKRAKAAAIALQRAVTVPVSAAAQ